MKSTAGAINLNPLQFDDLNCMFTQVVVNNEKVPADGYQMDFNAPAKVSTSVVEPMVELSRALGFDETMQSNGFGELHFISGYTCFAFPISMLPMSSSYEVVQTDDCITNITFKFKEGLTANMSLYLIFVKTHEVDIF